MRHCGALGAERCQPWNLRRAVMGDAPAIVSLVNAFAAEELLLPRSLEQVLCALDDYVVVADGAGRVLACGALREYSPSLAELVSLAVSREAQGLGLGRTVVMHVERLALRRGFDRVFAHTLSPRFFEAVGYSEVPRSLFPEKMSRPQTRCVQKVLVERGTAWGAAAWSREIARSAALCERPAGSCGPLTDSRCACRATCSADRVN